MKKEVKKGFTLIEMIVSVALLALISVIVIISLNKNLKDQDAKEYAEFIEKVKAGNVLPTQLGDYVDELWLLPSLR